MQNLTFEEKFKNYLRAAYPLLWIKTHEENRVTKSIINAINSSNNPASISLYSWDVKHQLMKYDSDNTSGGTKFDKVTGKDFGFTNVIENLQSLSASTVKTRNIIIMLDFHSYIEAPGQIRPIRNIIAFLKRSGHMIVFVSPVIKIPVELEKEIQILDYHLPDDIQIESILASVVKIYKDRAKEKGMEVKELNPDIKQATIEAAKGLTFSEAHDALSLAIMENKEFSNDFVHSVFEEKVKQIKRHGLLQYIKPDITFDGLGGLEGLKKWVRTRAKAYTVAAREYGLPYSKGVLLCGWPGCGKTAIAKATANEFGFPLFWFDIGALFGRYVGESEENTRKVIETLDSIGRCVVLID